MDHDIAVLIGRFEPFHNGHLALLQQALRLAPRCVVVIGSAYQARTPKNPFTWHEREQLVQLALPAAERERVRCVPLRDHYDADRWAREARRAVARTVAAWTGGSAPTAEPRVVLVGHEKDPTSDYLHHFSGWTLHATPRHGEVDASAIRDAWFGSSADAMPATLAALVDQVPASTADFLRAFAALPIWPRLVHEWQMLRDYHRAWSVAPYPPVFVTVDAVVTCARQVLLIRRGQPPGQGLLATPGGFLDQRESLYQAAVRELQEETHLQLLASDMHQHLKAVAVFDHPDRSQRGRTITHAFHFDLGDRPLPEVRAGDDAGSVAWLPIAELAALEDQFHDDHFHMLDHFLGLTAEEAA
jgi:bifunctional NMN adenylyltransferase/nudix hydrolase